MTARLDGVIERGSIREEVLRRLRAGIVYGEIEAGTIHSAPSLAARMGVSVTPVREALLELANRGMVVQVRNRGFRVVEHSRGDLDAALELRALVETPMMSRLVDKLDQAEIPAFREIVDDGIRAAHSGDLIQFLELDRQFHIGLLALAGNPRVVEVVDRVLDHLRLAASRSTSSTPPLVEVAMGHAAILDALESADPPAVELAVLNHLELTRTWAHRTQDDGNAAAA